MKIQIFIEDEGDRVIIDRSYLVLNSRAPEVNLQDLVDDAIVYLDLEKIEDLKIEATRITQHND